MTLTERIDRLVDGWCGERHLDALRILLPHRPPPGGLTDHWARVFEALKLVHEQASAEFTSGERADLESVILEAGRTVYR